jgi:hypothetical protein
MKTVLHTVFELQGGGEREKSSPEVLKFVLLNKREGKQFCLMVLHKYHSQKYYLRISHSITTEKPSYTNKIT